MPVDMLAENDTYIQLLYEAVQEGMLGLNEAPKILKEVLTNGRWRERRIATGDVVRFARWDEFVTTKPLKGLGTTVEMIDTLARTDLSLEAMIAIAKTQQAGGNRNPLGISGSNPPVNDNNIINDETQDGKRTSPTGTSSQQAHKRLASQSPELHARVLAGELSPHAAMIQAGFRKRTISVPIDPEQAARRLAAHFDLPTLTDLIARLVLIAEAARPQE